MTLRWGPSLRQQWALYRGHFTTLTPSQKAGVAALLVVQLMLLAYFVRGGGGELMNGAWSLLISGIARVSVWMSQSSLGIPLLYMIMIITGLPPLSGFSSALTLCGMAFARSEPKAPWAQQMRDLGWGWFVATLGLLVSACVSFVVLRRLLKKVQGRWALLNRIKSDRRFRALQHAVHERGFVMALLARFCPLPYSYTNLLLASLDSLSLKTYALSVLLTSPRLLFPVFMGAKLYDLSDKHVRAELDAQTKQLNVLFIVLSIGLAMLASTVIWREMSRMLPPDEPGWDETNEFALEGVEVEY